MGAIVEKKGLPAKKFSEAGED